MKLTVSFLCILCGALVSGTPAAGEPPDPIDQRIADARGNIAKDKKNTDAYNQLAIALTRRARESADPKYCAEADRTVDESLKIAPTAFDSRKVQVIVRLCEKRWAEALTEATALNKQIPDDLMMWGYMADAEIALGNYEPAEAHVQKMIDLRQVNPQGLERGAELRELFGFNDPAIEWWNSALRLTSATDTEERAWIFTRIARVDRILGRAEAAIGTAKSALTILPNYPWALDEMAAALADEKKYGEAAATLEERLRVAPGVPALFELGQAQSAAGNAGEAQRTFAEFEKQALARVNEADNANLQLARFYAGPGKRPAEAVRIAELTLAREHGVDVLEVYSSALAAQGNYKKAGEQIALALKPGVKNPAWLLEAGKLADKNGDAETAHKYYQEALEAAPSSPLAAEIIQALSGGAKRGS